jgi:ribosome-associated toxin RatA of RatAB toxin-antitoxin module
MATPGMTRNSRSGQTFAGIILMLLSLLLHPGPAHSTTASREDIAASEHSKLLNGEIIVNTSALSDGVTGVIGKIYIEAPPEHIWRAITDYDNQKNFVPKLIDSGLISDNGTEQVMFETGKTGVLLFRKTVHIKLKVKGDRLKRLEFHQIDGDFKIYQGEWVIESALNGKGSMLSFRAEIKPDFFAPAFFVRNVQEKDLPMVLSAMKKRAESTGTVGKSEKNRQNEAS